MKGGREGGGERKTEKEKEEEEKRGEVEGEREEGRGRERRPDIMYFLMKEHTTTYSLAKWTGNETDETNL